jgi:hypothetical protein
MLFGPRRIKVWLAVGDEHFDHVVVFVHCKSHESRARAVAHLRVCFEEFTSIELHASWKTHCSEQSGREHDKSFADEALIE